MQDKNKEKARHAAYYAANRETILAKNRTWRRTHKKQHKKLIKTWNKNNKKRKNEKAKIWEKNNPEKRRAISSKWKKLNPIACVIASAKRRSVKANSLGTFTVQEFTGLCKYYGNKCLCCGKKKTLTADHVVPLSTGGNNNISNIQPLCKSCNSKKGTKATDYRK